jgi:hypothetical protein
VLAVAICVLLSLASMLVVVKEWRAPFDSRHYRRPAYWPWSQRSWLAVKSGDLVGPAWFLTGAWLIVASERMSGIAAALFLAETLLLLVLSLVGEPRVLMPHALRGEFRGLLRAGNPQ